MKRQVLTSSKLCATVLSMLLAFHPVFAQAQKPDIAVTMFRDLVRFAAPSDVQEMRVEVFNSTGEKIYDSNFVAGQTQDWPLQDLQGPSVESGLYAYTVTVKDQGGALRQMRRGNIIVDRKREGLEAAPPIGDSQARPSDSIQPQPESWDVDHGKNPYIINAPAMGIGTRNPLTRLHIGAGTTEPITKGSTLLLEEGEATGMVLKSTTGAEMFFSQDQKHGLFGTASNHPLGFRTNNQNRFWITEEGNVGVGTTNPGSPLTVAGVIETTSGGIKFPDGTIQTTAAIAIGDNPKSSSTDVSKAASQNKATTQERSPGKGGAGDGTITPKFSVNEDLTVNGNIIFTPPVAPPQARVRDITVQDNTGGLRFYGAPSLVSSPAAAVQIFGNGSFLPGQLYLDSGAHDNGAVILRTARTGGTITERMRVTATGNVGVGRDPGQLLDVHGPAANIRVSSSSDAQHGVIVSPEGTLERAYLYATGGNANHSGRLRLSNGNSDITAAEILMRNAAGATVNYITNSGNSFFNGGNVGIGRDPGQLLDVHGPAANIRVSSSSDAQHGVIVSPEGSLERAYLYATGGNANHSGRLRLSNGNSDITAAEILMRNAAGTTVNYITNSGNSFFNGGNVGIGATNPDSKLTVAGDIHLTTGGVKFPDGTTQATRGLALAGLNTVVTAVSLTSGVNAETFMSFNTNVNPNGVGLYGQAIGGSAVKGVSTNGRGVWGQSIGGNGVYGESSSVSGYGGRFTNTATGGIALYVDGQMQITGGADLSEQFEIEPALDSDRKTSLPQVEPGMVVSIDPTNPGKLLISSRAYDRTVAGIISGAGGIKPGMLMGQSGSIANGAHPVALTGRVYCWADTANGAIHPGDLLTASNTPGYAMKVTNHAKAQGAILGKAMSSLRSGRGLVLVLVTLQ